MEKARAGEDFAELAKTYSEGPSKDNGGQLGEFKREDMVKPFSDAAFAMAVGDISEPVKNSVWMAHYKGGISQPGIHPGPGRRHWSDHGKNWQTEKPEILAYDAALSLYDITFDGEELEKKRQ